MLQHAASRLAGPLARTAAELENLRRLAAFRREREMRWHQRLRESDVILDLVEECRVRGYDMLPGQVWASVVRFIGEVDPSLRDDLGSSRTPDQASEALFAAQAEICRRRLDERVPRTARIIPLFAAAAAPRAIAGSPADTG
ncbi:MAG TPA: hypothetical protein VH134_10640 [Candidatus Dormibacteraeota bacterium]|jgi:hypothetical protein|nr:hypothetical protein [Candidatus Dormibacteraeota bacterium]